MVEYCDFLKMAIAKILDFLRRLKIRSVTPKITLTQNLKMFLIPTLTVSHIHWYRRIESFVGINFKNRKSRE